MIRNMAILSCWSVRCYRFDMNFVQDGPMIQVTNLSKTFTLHNQGAAEIAVMSGNSAANTLLQIKVAGLEASGQKISDEDKTKLLDEIKASYNEQLSPYYAASRLWVDGIIDPLTTRTALSEGIKAANLAPIEKPMNVGVIQT